MMQIKIYRKNTYQKYNNNSKLTYQLYNKQNNNNNVNGLELRKNLMIIKNSVGIKLLIARKNLKGVNGGEIYFFKIFIIKKLVNM